MLDWAMKPRRKQVRGEFNLYPLYEENDYEYYYKYYDYHVSKLNGIFQNL